MRPRPATALMIAGALLLAACSLLLAACSDDKEAVPVACSQGPDVVRAALQEAPGPVTIDGSPLSECIKDTSGGGDLREVGISYVNVASRLAPAAASDPNGREALQLGYLIGAFEKSKAGAQGVGYELGRRLHSELLRVDMRAPAFRQGHRAGRTGG